MEEEKLELIGSTSEPSTNTVFSTVTSSTINTNDIPMQSAYRPSARPTSKYAVSSSTSLELVMSTSRSPDVAAMEKPGMYMYVYDAKI